MPVPERDEKVPGAFILASGRHVLFQRLFVDRTALGSEIGSPERIREEVLGNLLTATAKRLFGPEIGHFLHPPPDGPLPPYLLMAEFMSPQPVRSEYHASVLLLCWF